jgi:dTMP kinase
MKKSGTFISFEGTEGSGKTTQIERLAQRLSEAGHSVIVTREPGGTVIGEAIRDLLKDVSKSSSIFPEAELLLFAASRAQLVREVILPALAVGKTILCDRFLDSTTVYQGIARKINAESLNLIHKFVLNALMPDVTIIIDVPPEIGLQRARKRPQFTSDRLEQENIEFYQAVRNGYLSLAKMYSERFCVVNGCLNLDTIETEIWNAITRKLNR